MGTVGKHVNEKHETAWGCKDCGHIMSQTGDKAPTGKCPQCHADPAHFIAAEISDEPIDAGLPAAADYARDEVDGNDPAGLFSTSVAGASGDVSINPELKVRY